MKISSKKTVAKKKIVNPSKTNKIQRIDQIEAELTYWSHHPDERQSKLQELEQLQEEIENYPSNTSPKFEEWINEKIILQQKIEKLNNERKLEHNPLKKTRLTNEIIRLSKKQAKPPPYSID